MSSASAQRRTLTFVFFTVFLDLLGAGILIPILPYLVRQFRTDAMTVGLLSVAFSGAQFFAAPVLGAISDRIGRRPVLLFSILGSALGYFLFGWAGSLWLMFFARVVDGITGGNISTAMAAIADITEPKDRAKNFGLIGMAFGLGFIIGPALGGLLSKISLQAPAYGAAVIAMVTAAFGYFALPETLPADRRRQGGAGWADLSPFRPILSALERPQLRLLLGALFFLNFAFAALQTNFSNFTMDRFQFTAEQNAWVFAFIGFTVAVLQGGVVRRLLPVFGETKLAVAGFLLFVAGFLVLASSWIAWWVYPSVGLIAIGSAFTNPTLNAMVSKRASAVEQGSILGTTQSVLSLTRVFGPAWAGLVFDHFGSGAPYWTGAGFIALALMLALPVMRENAPAS
ncbi:MAG: TCR/Tet family MFS transporter [Acidobacteria bacterium]|nr:TCR/Tet family MFS transporter [Acidobacteriota bacterium]